MDIKILLEKLTSMSAAERKPTGPKFPGYWKGKDPAAKSRSRMVGSAQESVLPEIHRQANEGKIERRLRNQFEVYKQLSEQTKVANVSKEVLDKLMKDPRGLPMWDETPQSVMTSSGPLLTGSGDPVVTTSGKLRYVKPEPGPIYARWPDEVAAQNDKDSNVAKDNVSEPVATTYPVSTPKVTSSEIPVVGASIPDRKLPTPVDLPPIPAGTSVRNLEQDPRQDNTPIDYVSLIRQNPDKSKISRNEIIGMMAKLNDIKDPNKIRVGQVITLHRSDGTPYKYQIGKGDNLWNISRGILKGKAM